MSRFLPTGRARSPPLRPGRRGLLPPLRPGDRDPSSTRSPGKEVEATEGRGSVTFLGGGAGGRPSLVPAPPGSGRREEVAHAGPAPDPARRETGWGAEDRGPRGSGERGQERQSVSPDAVPARGAGRGRRRARHSRSSKRPDASCFQARPVSPTASAGTLHSPDALDRDSGR